MSDAQFIPGLIKLASNPAILDAEEQIAAKKILKFDGEIFPADSCAISQSCLLQAAGIDVPDTYLAIAMGEVLMKRGWKRIEVGQQRAGDLGSTCKAVPDHGNDHVFLVLRALNPFEDVIVDNQARVPHIRFTDGRDGKTPATFFLRAS